MIKEEADTAGDLREMKTSYQRHLHLHDASMTSMFGLIPAAIIKMYYNLKVLTDMQRRKDERKFQ